MTRGPKIARFSESGRDGTGRASLVAGFTEPAFSPHDLRHRRISCFISTACGEHVGQRNLAVTANTYSHVLVAEDELDYADLLPSR
jgi:integrase